MGEAVALAILVGIVVLGAVIVILWPIEDSYMPVCPDCGHRGNLVLHNLLQQHVT